MNLKKVFFFSDEDDDVPQQTKPQTKTRKGKNEL